MPAAVAIPALIGAGSSIFSGFMGSRAANNAANVQNQAAQQAAAQSIAAGEAAAGGVEGAVQTGVGRVDAATGQAIGQATAGTQAGIDAVNAATAAGNTTLAATLEQQRANLNPFQQAGTQALSRITDITAPGGALAERFAFDGRDLANDPGYQFQLQQGQQALERSAAARGAITSGGTLRSLSRFNQGLAATSFGDAFERARQTFDTNRQSTALTLSSLQNMAGMGLTSAQSANQAEGAFGSQVSGNLIDAGGFEGAGRIRLGEFAGNAATRGAEFGASLGMQGATNAGQFRTNATRDAGEFQTQGANARAAGTVGSANAWSGAITGAAGAVQDAFTLRSLTQRPGRTTPLSVRQAAGPDWRMMPQATGVRR